MPVEALEFTKLDLESIKILKNISGSFIPYSDFNTLSLFVWDSARTNSYCIHNNNLIIKISDYLGTDMQIGLLGRNKIMDTIDSLRSYVNYVRFIPEEMLPLLDPRSVHIMEDRDNFDYVLDIESFTTLSGKKYKKLRKKVAAFSRIYPNVELKMLNLSSSHDCSLVYNLASDWCMNKRMPKKELEDNLASLNTYFSLNPLFDTFNTGLFLGGSMIAFSLNELLPNKWVMGHFGKSILDYENSSIIMEYENAKLLGSKGYRYLNIQQDTGLLGLRASKLALQPRLLKKYFLKFM